MCCTAPLSPRSANGEAEQRSIGVDRNALLRDESRKALLGECSKTNSTMPDTMGMVSTDEAFSIAARGLRGRLLAVGSPTAGPPVVLEKSAIYMYTRKVYLLDSTVTLCQTRLQTYTALSSELTHLAAHCRLQGGNKPGNAAERAHVLVARPHAARLGREAQSRSARVP